VAKTKVVKPVVKKDIPNFPPEQLALYNPRYHSQPGIDPPIAGIANDLGQRIPCVAEVHDSCMGRFISPDRLKELSVAYPLKEDLARAGDSSTFEKLLLCQYPDSDFSSSFKSGAGVELRYRTDPQNLAQAQELEDALTSRIYLFTVGDRGFRAKIACLEKEEGISVHARPHRRVYYLKFDRPVTDPIMLACMWREFERIVKKFTKKTGA